MKAFLCQNIYQIFLNVFGNFKIINSMVWRDETWNDFACETRSIFLATLSISILCRSNQMIENIKRHNNMSWYYWDQWVLIVEIQSLPWYNMIASETKIFWSIQLETYWSTLDQTDTDRLNDHGDLVRLRIWSGNPDPFFLTRTKLISLVANRPFSGPAVTQDYWRPF